MIPSLVLFILPKAVPVVSASSFCFPLLYLSLRLFCSSVCYLLAVPCITVLACRLCKRFLSYKSQTVSLPLLICAHQPPTPTLCPLRISPNSLFCVCVCLSLLLTVALLSEHIALLWWQFSVASCVQETWKGEIPTPFESRVSKAVIGDIQYYYVYLFAYQSGNEKALQLNLELKNHTMLFLISYINGGFAMMYYSWYIQWSRMVDDVFMYTKWNTREFCLAVLLDMIVWERFSLDKYCIFWF